MLPSFFFNSTAKEHIKMYIVKLGIVVRVISVTFINELELNTNKKSMIKCSWKKD